MSTLLLFASQLEADATIATLGATATEGPVPSYRFEAGYIAVGGIGSVAAATAVGYYAREVATVWSLGIAGSLVKPLAVGDCVEVGSCRKHIAYPSYVETHSRVFAGAAFPDITLQSEGPVLVSSDYPVHTEEDRALLSKSAQLIDMEGHAIALASERLQLPCRMTRVITDLCAPDGPQRIRDNIRDAAEVIAAVIQKTTPSVR